MRIDAHQHFWLYDSVKDAWITEEMATIQRNFLPNDISGNLKQVGFDGVIAIQAAQTHRETEFLVELSRAYALIKGVVGWVDLQSEKIEDYLIEFSKQKVIKGFRHIVEGEQDPDFLTRREFLRGIRALTKFNFTYDLLVHSRHYSSTISCVESNPDQAFVLDHMAKPAIKTKEFDDWANFIEKLASYQNVQCKISGLVTEADWKHWKLEHFTEYMDYVIKCFGRNRVMFGSDWPVCLLAGSYEDTLKIVDQSLGGFSEEELKNFWGNNAVKFYSLS